MLRAGGRTAFLTIVVAAGLSKAAHRRGVRLGPRAVASSRPTEELMSAAGFIDVDVTDASDDFLETARFWFTEFSLHEQELRAVLGDALDEQQSDRRDMIRGVEEGLLRRVLVAATAPAV
jgi:hypothetical protein